MASLAQQRLAFERERFYGWVAVVLGVISAATSVGLIWAGIGASWPALVIWAGWIAFGVYRIRRARRTRIAFEAEHGPDAGARA